jgi:hypothetical protein
MKTQERVTDIGTRDYLRVGYAFTIKNVAIVLAAEDMKD